MARLTGLTHLSLNGWSLARLPPAFSNLGSLAALELVRGLGPAPDASALDPLVGLTGLTSLNLSRCGLRTAPTGLRRLTVSGSLGRRAALAEAWEASY